LVVQLPPLTENPAVHVGRVLVPRKQHELIRLLNDLRDLGGNVFQALG
jgi:hypothetical protein